jgi:hypothetical protein
LHQQSGAQPQTLLRGLWMRCRRDRCMSQSYDVFLGPD